MKHFRQSGKHQVGGQTVKGITHYIGGYLNMMMNLKYLMLVVDLVNIFL